LVTVPPEDRLPLVLDFFAPTCLPCKDAVPALFAKRAEIEAKGARLVLVGVLADSESTEDARRALASWGVRAPFLKDSGGVSQRELGVDKLPATVILDGKGVVRWVAPDRATAEDVVTAVR
jgi:thiol-disulfide isomerase/thioredoxin